MSNRDPEATYDDPVQAIEFAIREWIRQNLRTSVPGIVRAYDARTLRARVQPALNAIIATPDGDESMERAPIYDVPVTWPGGGGFVFHCDLNAGDTVWLMFSERGIARFKQDLTLSDPPPMVMFATCDAVAMPWRTAAITPVEGQPGGSIEQVTPTASGSITNATGATLQTVGGLVYVSVRENEVKVAGPDVTIDGNVTISGSLKVNGTSVRHRTKNIGDTHVHPETGTVTQAPNP